MDLQFLHLQNTTMVNGINLGLAVFHRVFFRRAPIVATILSFGIGPHINSLPY